MQTVRFGLIGYGAWGQCHAGAIDKTAEAQLAAICARSEASSRAAREAYPEAAIYSDYRQLLEQDDLDVIDIVLPSHLHHEVSSAALAAGGADSLSRSGPLVSFLIRRTDESLRNGQQPSAESSGIAGQLQRDCEFLRRSIRGRHADTGRL